MSFDFSDIRFFSDADLKDIIPTLIEEPTIFRISRYFLNEITKEEFESMWHNFKTIEEFQLGFIVPLMNKIISESSKELIGLNLNNIDTSKANLFITNHRNIVMDAALLNILLIREFENRIKTTAIAIGNNLLSIPWIRNLARINKSFIVERDTSVQQMLESSKRLSAYVREVITKQNNSIWIAQREGRTKDGNDLTQAGLLKMLNMTSRHNFVDSFMELNILPVSISYEIDPTEKMKLVELATIESGKKYEKAPMEDFNSMFIGITGEKGRIHYNFGKIIDESILEKCDKFKPLNEKIKALGDHIDEFIYQNFQLWPSNYIATDIINNNAQFNSYYTHEEKSEFIDKMNNLIDGIDMPNDLLKPIYLKMYAYPVRNKFQKKSELIFNY